MVKDEKFTEAFSLLGNDWHLEHHLRTYVEQFVCTPLVKKEEGERSKVRTFYEKAREESACRSLHPSMPFGFVTSY